VRASISVARVPAADGDTVASITDAGRANLENAYGKAAAVTVPVQTRLAGAPAMRFEYEAEGGQVRQLGALHAGNFYLVSFTASRSTWSERVRALDGMLRSWQWK